MYRTHTCGELTKENIGQTVTIAGWVNKVRNFGGMTFIDLRDRYGITQICIDPTKVDMKKFSDVLDEIKQEYVLKVTGVVVPRPEGMENKSMSTGEIEIQPTSIEILTRSKTLPFAIADDPNTSEENRFKHRYLDLRRRKPLENVIFRSRMTMFTRQWFTQRGFLDVQTPIFTVSSPEGARDYLVPSRLHPGHFYALPQAPQQYKQLLMIGGIDKYIQIAPCFRDEDPRADRHSCEFYQIDCEMSFVEKDDIFQIVEEFFYDLVKELAPHKRILSVKEVQKIKEDGSEVGAGIHAGDQDTGRVFMKLQYKQAIDRYGSDKPDVRFGMTLVDVTELFERSEFNVFRSVLANGGCIKAIKVSNKIFTKKEIQELTDVVVANKAKGLAYLCNENGEITGSFAKFLSEEEKKNIQQKFALKYHDTIFFVADMYDIVTTVLGKLRLFIRDKYLTLDPHILGFVWIDHFPMFEQDPETGKLDFAHNPFSMVQRGREALKNENKLAIIAEQYDLACNGYEILSGSIRNHDPELLVEVFKIVGRTEEEVKRKFGAMYEAFQYGPPPHGGFAIGFDRLMMILKDETNIREVYAFPKSGRAQDIMMGAPSIVDDEQLQELHIRVIQENSQ